MEIIKKYWWIILIGLCLRLFIAAFTYHPDVKIVAYTSAIILGEDNLNPYSFASALSATDSRKAVFSGETPDDLPLQYWIHIPIDLLTRPFISANFEYQFFSDTSLLLGNSNIYSYLLAIKLPLIMFDLGIGLLLIYLVSLSNRKKALLIWMLNPMTLWATAAVGQVDIFPTFFVILAALLLKRGQTNFSALSLGIGGALKSFPFLLAPFLILLADSWRDRLKLTILISIPWLLSVIPYLGSPEFRSHALFAPQMDKMLYSKIPLSGGESLIITVSLLVILYLLYLRVKRGFRDFVSFSTTVLLVVLSFTHFHIQWFLWVVPFIIFYLMEGGNKIQKWSVAFMSLAVLIMLFLFESSLQVDLFSPLFPGLSSSSGLAEILAPQQVTFLRGLAASIFTASAVAFSAILILRTERVDKIYSAELDGRINIKPEKV